MNRIGAAILCLSALCIGSFTILAQERSLPHSVAQQAASQPASRVASKPAPQQKAPLAYPREPLVIDQYFTSVRFESNGATETRLNTRIQIQDDAGAPDLDLLLLPIYSAGDTIDITSFRVRHGDGTVSASHPQTALKPVDLKLPSFHPGDTIESEIVVHSSNPEARNEVWAAHTFLTVPIVLDERYEVNLASSRTVLVKSPAAPYEKTESNGRTIYRWKHSNRTRDSQADSGSNAATPKSPYVTSAPDVQLSSFATWDSLARWLSRGITQASEPTPEIESEVAEITQPQATDLDKIRAIYTFISQKIHFLEGPVAISQKVLRPAAEILKDGKGDAEDKAILFVSMCRAARIPADTAFLPFARKLDSTFTSPTQFDHVITVIPQGSELLWMDATQDVAPFRFLASVLRGKSALLVSPGGLGKLAGTPADPPFPSTQRVEIDGQVSELGKLTAQLHYVLRGDTEFVLRRAFHDSPQSQWGQLAQTIMTLDGLQGKVDSVLPSDPLDTKNPFDLQISFTRDAFLDWASKQVKVGMPLLTLGLPDIPSDASKPAELGSPLSVTTELKIALPDNFTARAPVGISVSRDYADFKSSYRFENHSLVATRFLDFKMRTLSAERTSDYVAFTHAVQSDENQGLLVENVASGTPVLPLDSTPDQMIEAGLAALDSGNFRSAIPLFQRVLETDPAHSQAWNDLGLAYLRAADLDNAAAAFRKQIEADPSVGHPYDYLGLTLQQQQKFDDAAASFEKQAQLDPLDPTAHAALGSQLLAQFKYREAIPELEKAAILSPENADLEVGLGQAYKNTGQNDEAIAALEKGAGLSKSPEIWNTVARSLSNAEDDENGALDLPMARQYAQAALSSVSADLLKLDSSRITKTDLARVARLGDYWDTLGWIYFQQGDGLAGERYIQSSWLLTQHGAAAGHLGKIAEKRKQKDQAIHMYALALAAPHPAADTRARLTLLLGGNTGLDGLVNNARPELLSLRSLDAGKLLAEDAHADFLILLSPAGPASPENSSSQSAVNRTSYRVNKILFVGGSEKLAPFASRLRSLNYGPVFPDSAPVEIVRRGTLSCSSSSGDCALVLAVPEEVRTAN